MFDDIVRVSKTLELQDAISFYARLEFRPIVFGNEKGRRIWSHEAAPRVNPPRGYQA